MSFIKRVFKMQKGFLIIKFFKKNLKEERAMLVEQHNNTKEKEVINDDS